MRASVLIRPSSPATPVASCGLALDPSVGLFPPSGAVGCSALRGDGGTGSAPSPEPLGTEMGLERRGKSFGPPPGVQPAGRMDGWVDGWVDGWAQAVRAPRIGAPGDENTAFLFVCFQEKALRSHGSGRWEPLRFCSSACLCFLGCVKLSSLSPRRETPRVQHRFPARSGDGRG